MFKKLLLHPLLAMSLVSTALAADSSQKLYQIECLIVLQPNAAEVLAQAGLQADLTPETKTLLTGASMNLGRWSGLQHGRIPNFTRLPSRYWRLSGLDQRLGSSTLLYHLAWRQPLLKDPQTVSLKLGFPTPHSDTVSLDQIRFTEDDAAQARFPITGQLSFAKSLYVKTGFLLNIFDSSGSDRNLLSRIDTARSIKFGKLTYIDHPAFGVLILIEPV